MTVEFGLVIFYADGRAWSLRGDWTYSPQTIVKQPIAGWDGLQGFQTEPRAPFIAGSLSKTEGVDLAALIGLVGNVTLELRDGTALSLSDAQVVGEVDGNASTGEIPIRFAGRELTQVT